MKLRVRISSDVTAMVNELVRRSGRASRIDTALENAASKLAKRAQSHSRGRPGPNIVTQAFHDSWTYAVSAGDNSAMVANGSAYAARLEFGFVGVDSIGRFYSQPPYPSLSPAVGESEDLLAEELTKVLFR